MGNNQPGTVTVSLTFDHIDMASLLSALRRNANTRHSLFSQVADQIEAQTKPPRIPEPGFWAVVQSPSGDNPTSRKWVRYGTGWRDAFGSHAEWEDLTDPALIRDGLS